jgi:hypothetical protein
LSLPATVKPLCFVLSVSAKGLQSRIFGKRAPILPRGHQSFY